MDEGSVYEDIGYTPAAMSPVVPTALKVQLSKTGLEPATHECSVDENKRQLREARRRLGSPSRSSDRDEQAA